MPVIILCLFRFVRLLGSGHQAIVVEKLALRLQLAAFKRKRKRPVLTQWDRLFWIGMSRPCSNWRDSVLFVQPDTVAAGSGLWPRTFYPCRAHRAIEEECPIERQIMEQGTIVEIVELGGLHHRYERIAA